LNIAVLAGSFLGPLIAQWAGVSAALLAIAGGRALSAFVLWRWGR